MQTLQRPSAQEILSGADHPLAAGYKRVRAFIDSLPRLGSNPGSRLYAERGDQGTFAEVFPPALTCRWKPGLFPELGTAQPTGDAWLDYLERVVEAGAPEGTLTGNLGYWTLGAGDRAAFDEQRLAAESRGLQYRPVDGTVQYRAYTPERWEKILSLVTEVFGAPQAAAEPAATTRPAAQVAPAPAVGTSTADAPCVDRARATAPAAARLPRPAPDLQSGAACAHGDEETPSAAVPWAEDLPAPSADANRKKPAAPSPPRRRSRQKEKEDVLEFSFS